MLFKNPKYSTGKLINNKKGENQYEIFQYGISDKRKNDNRKIQGAFR